MVWADGTSGREWAGEGESERVEMVSRGKDAVELAGEAMFAGACICLGSRSALAYNHHMHATRL